MASSFPIQVGFNHEEYDIRYFPVKAAETFIAGALVVFDATTNHNISECGADPTTILGVALAPASVGLDSRGSIYGGTKIPVAILTPNVVCWVASATTPTINHVGNKYGVVKSTFWLVDTSDTTNTRVTVEDVAPIVGGPAAGVGQEGYLVRFLAANLQFSEVVS